ncbi:MAG: peptide deformylase [Patescibacteria group bacterium]
MNSTVATQVGSGHLRAVCEPVSIDQIGTDEINEIVAKMRQINDAMGGVGISANQVGHNLRISIVAVRPTEARPDQSGSAEYVMFNPEIVHSAGKTKMYEGCLSVAEAGLFANVTRAKKVTVKYTDESGSEMTKELSGLEGRVVQHEIAHLNGRVFLDEKYDPESLKSRSEYLKFREKQRKNV